jgi:CRISPR/Cas system-associated exonuclease Cas4 (RecB family)
MTYSYTQISQYLTCPRRYRHRYVDGWKEKDTRAAMLFGRAFELALGAYFRREDPGEALHREWSASKDQDLQYSNRDTWDRMLDQELMLLTRFCQDDRVRVPWPRRNLQIKFTRRIGQNNFVSYVDSIGRLDGTRCVLEWKTAAARYAEEPQDLLALDPQLVWKQLRLREESGAAAPRHERSST